MEISSGGNVTAKTKEIQINKKNAKLITLAFFYIIPIHQSIMIWTYLLL